MDHAQARLPLPTKLAVELNAQVTQLPRAGMRPHCPQCHNPLDLHQPDESAPEDLLAICDSCSRWYLLLEIGKQGRLVLLVELPGRPVVEEFAQKNDLLRR